MSTGNLPTYLYKLIPGSKPELLPNSDSEDLPLSPKDTHDGFIHLSTSKQVRGTVLKHCAEEERVHVLRIKYEVVESDIKWEPSRGKEAGEIGDPHMYAHLDLERWKKDVVDETRVFDLGWLNLDH